MDCRSDCAEAGVRIGFSAIGGIGNCARSPSVGQGRFLFQTTQLHPKTETMLFSDGIFHCKTENLHRVEWNLSLSNRNDAVLARNHGLEKRK